MSTDVELLLSEKQRAINMLQKGFTPEDILKHDIESYFTHYKAIESCYRLIVEAELSLITYGEEE